jgi:hypothetical protein
VVLGCKMKIKAKHLQAVAKNKKKVKKLGFLDFYFVFMFFGGLKERLKQRVNIRFTNGNLFFI